MRQWDEDAQISYSIEPCWLAEPASSDPVANMGLGDATSPRDVDCSPPRCFTRSQWRDWNAAAQYSALAHESPPAAGYCTDCTREYQQEMVAAGRCEHPETVFVMVKRNRKPSEHAVEGRWPSENNN